MRGFVDSQGVKWSVAVKKLPGPDYKGRYVFAAKPLPGSAGARPEEIVLDDVCWNSEKAARLAIETMSAVELDRRIAWARGRSAVPTR